MSRKIALSEYIHQGPEEMRRQAPDLEFQFEVYNDRVMMYQMVDHMVKPYRGGPAVQAQIPMPCLQVGDDYDFWQVGLSRRDVAVAAKATARKEAERADKQASDDSRDEVAEKLAWAIDKDRGNGTHIGYGAHKPAG